MPDSPPQPGLLDRLAAILGPRGLLTDPNDIAPHLADWRALYRGASLAVARPASTEEVAAVVRLCAETRTPIVPQGGNTSMVGGATPDESGRAIVVSLSRLNRIRGLDTDDMTMTAEAGLVLKAAQDAAAEGTATIGGVLSTNAGGNTTVRYGNARELMLGLEAVLPDGSIWNGLRRLRKDNTGYALRHLLVGAEGTLGIVTAAVLRLFPRPHDAAVAFCAVADEDAALALFRRFRDRDESAVRAFEYISGTFETGTETSFFTLAPSRFCASGCSSRMRQSFWAAASESAIVASSTSPASKAASSTDSARPRSPASGRGEARSTST